MDVMIPHATDSTAITKKLADMTGITGVGTMIKEMDKRVTNIKIVIEGKNIQSKRVEAAIESLGGSIHSVDNIVAGKVMVEDVKTLQD